ncbi:MAG: dihydropyrimidinase [Alphaproteobacteria bacterium]|nr:dihydropyrimidinase [Alphaproteobacteria bacterium]
MGYDLVVKGGRIATAADLFEADIGVRGGRIVAIGEDLGLGDRTIDARGRLITPGGIDAHAHIEQISSTGVWTADDWFTATRSAACGGTTVVMPFAAQHKGDSIRQVVADYHDRAGPKACIDYGFHMIISDPRPEIVDDELPELIRKGYTSFKIYLTYDALKLNDREVLEVYALARREGAFVMVHAENHDSIAFLAQKLLAAGHKAPKFHAVSRPQAVEREATHRAITLAELVDQPVLIVHVSGAEAFDQIRWAQARGLRIYAETCPQYLFLCAEDLDQPGIEGAKCMCSPPPREKANQPAVWRAIANGVAQVFSSDHAPYRFGDADGKQKALQDFKKVPNGVPGLELRMPLLFSEGVGKGRIDIHTFVAVTATNPARLYGLSPRKGSIAVGADADLVIWDPDRAVTVSHSLLHDAMDYTPYEGMQLTGWPIETLCRGVTVAKEMEFVGQAGFGQFHCRPLSDMARPVGRFPTGFNPHDGSYQP